MGSKMEKIQESGMAGDADAPRPQSCRFGRPTRHCVCELRGSGKGKSGFLYSGQLEFRTTADLTRARAQGVRV